MFLYLSLGVEDSAWEIMDGEGSVPRTVLKEEESSREMRPWPQPRSRRRFEGGAW